jgi:hypothetical protein
MEQNRFGLVALMVAQGEEVDVDLSGDGIERGVPLTASGGFHANARRAAGKIRIEPANRDRKFQHGRQVFRSFGILGRLVAQAMINVDKVDAKPARLLEPRERSREAKRIRTARKSDANQRLVV